ncbi:MAG: DUF2723 domain-containing protein [Candidatus Eremiobacterota bacterium]
MSETRRQVILGSVAFVLASAVLVPSVAPSIPGGHDSGEVLSCAVVLGIPHPPGYPLYAMLGHLWSYLPVGDYAYRLNLFSAFSLALAGAFLAVAFARVASPAAGLTGALLYCFAFSPWRQGSGAEVFALHLCILSALVLLAILYGDNPTLRRRRWITLLGFSAFGLGAAHHHTIALAVPGILGYLAWSRGRGKPWGMTWIALLAGLFLALAPYAYLYIRARQDCPMNWGDPSTPRTLAEHMLRKAYGTGALNPASGTVERSDHAQTLAYFASLIRNQFPFPLVLLGLGGLILAFRRPRILFLYGWIFFIYGPGFALYSAQPPHEFYLDMVERFYASSYIGAAGFVSLGLAWFEQRIRASRFPRAAWALPLLALYSVSMNWTACSQAGQYHPNDHMESILDYVPKGAVLCVDGDLPAGEYDYYAYVIKKRPDVIGVFPGLLAAEWYTRDFPNALGPRMMDRWTRGEEKEMLQAFVDLCREDGLEVYCTTNFSEASKGQFLPEGLVFRYLKADEPAPDKNQRLATARKVLRFLESRQRRGDYRLSLRNQTFWTRYCIGHWVRAYRNTARDLYPDDIQGAELALRRALEMDPGYVRDWLNLALLYMDQHRWDEADQALDQILEREPGNLLALAAKVDLFKSQGNRSQAEHWQARLEKKRRATQ